MDDLLQIKNLSLKANSSSGWETIVQNVNINIKPGEAVGLVGESGSGKSLTATSVMGLLPRNIRPGGKIIFRGKDILDSSNERIRQIRGKEIAMIFQEPLASLNPLHTSGRQINEALKRNRDRSDIKELLEKVGLDQSILQKYPHQISGGQRQRILMLIMLAQEPRLLIADEPTTALDASLRRQTLKLLSSLTIKEGKSLLLISHDINMVKRFTQRIYIMHQGIIMEEGKTLSVLTRPKNSWTKRLAAAQKLGSPVTLRKKIVPLLRIKSLTVNYPIRRGVLRRVKGHVHALAPLSFSLSCGETMGVIGESGSGKSSLALAIMRLLNNDEWGGEANLIVDGKNIKISSLRSDELRSTRPLFQMIFQDPFSSLNPRFTLRNSIMEGLKLLPDISHPEQQVSKVMEEVKLSHSLLDVYPRSLSGGQRQRAAIARALIMQPRLLILDEPTSSLDSTVQLEIINLLRSLQRERKLSYIFITHDINLAKAISHKCLVLRSGKLVEQGTDVLRRPKNDYTRMLVNAHKFA